MTSDGTFIGPAVQVIAPEPARTGLLQDVYLRQMGGRDFLVGKLIAFCSDQRDGLETWCALDHTLMCIHFPDVDAALKYRDERNEEIAQEERKQRRWWQR
jgi:hypothetical protein